MTALAIARQLLARGCSVIPIPRPDGRHDGKTPAIAWREFQARRPTDAELVSWFGGEPMNLGIVTGAVSGVVVVDCDSLEALRWWTRHRPYTPWQTKTARGFHLFYRHPGVDIRNQARGAQPHPRRCLGLVARRMATVEGRCFSKVFAGIRGCANGRANTGRANVAKVKHFPEDFDGFRGSAAVAHGASKARMALVSH